MTTAAVNYPGVQLSWKRVLSIARNIPDPASAIHIEEEDGDEDDDKESPNSRLQCMGRALQNIYIITSQDEGYAAFILTMIQELNFDCPIEMTFLKHVLDYSEIPSKSTLQQLLVCWNNNTSKKEKINSCILWSILARKFAGNLAEAMWQDEIADNLINVLLLDIELFDLKKYALLALESFALTGGIKKRILLNHHDILSALYQNLQICQVRLSPYSPTTTAHVSLNLTLSSHDRYSGKRFYHGLMQKLNNKFTKFNKKNKKGVATTTSNALYYHEEAWSDIMQLQHCVQWSLDHVFHQNNTTTTKSSVYLNPKDCTSHCKLSEPCLEIRNDTFFLESIRANASVDRDVWYYEVLLLTNGVIQLGWGTSRCVFLSEEGCGVGDDRNGFAFDTYRSAIWASSEAIYYPQANSGSCKAGDVIGTLLDMNQGTCTFFVNGQDLGLTVQFHTNVKKKMLGLYPIISLTHHQHVVVNFGDEPWLYHPATHSNYQPMSHAAGCDAVVLKDEGEEEEYDWDGPLCTLCFSEPKDTLFLPCQHDGFGTKCSLILESCPLCRTKISKRVITGDVQA